MSLKRVKIPVRRTGEPKSPVEIMEEALLADESAGVEEDASVLKRKKRARQQAATVDWHAQAVRLQAELDNFRKRQQQLAATRIAQEKATLLRQLLPVVDDLGRTLANLSAQDVGQVGVQAAFDALQALLRAQDVTPIPTVEQPFDPTWHEAVAVLPAEAEQLEDLRIVAEQRVGYRLGERLLRPAQVVVAKK